MKFLFENNYRFGFLSLDLPKGGQVVDNYLIPHAYNNDNDDLCTDCDEMVIYKYPNNEKDGGYAYAYKTRSFGSADDFDTEYEAFDDINNKMEYGFLSDWGLDFEIICIESDADRKRAYDKENEMAKQYEKPEKYNDSIEIYYLDDCYHASGYVAGELDIEIEANSFEELIKNVKETIENTFSKPGYPVSFENDIDSTELHRLRNMLDNNEDVDTVDLGYLDVSVYW